MSKKVYKIAERDHYFKHIKKTNGFYEHVRFDVLPLNFDTSDEAEAYIEKLTSNAEKYNPNGATYEKIAENTYKLTYSTSKNYRILGYQICEFENI